MKTQLETISQVRRKISVEIPVERVAETLEKAYQKIQKTAKLKGFREGHVPRNLLELHFKPDAEQETIRSLIDSTYREALEKETVFPVSRPQVNAGPFQAGAVFSYTAEFEVHPTLEVSGHHGLSLEKTERPIPDDLVEKRLLAVQRSMTQLEPAPDGTKAEKGIVALIDFDGTADGAAFKGNKAENFLVDIGSGSLLSQFEDKIVGMIKGEKRRIEFDYPPDYYNKDLSGKHGVFDVKVKDLKVKKVPELNDDFAKDLGNFKTLDDVREDIRKKLGEVAEHEAKRELAESAMEQLIKKHKFEIPSALVMDELKGMFDSFVYQLSKQGKKFEDSGITAEQFIEKNKPIAENNVRGYYILDAIAKMEHIEVNDDDLEGRFKLIAANANQPLSKVKEYYTNNNLTTGLKMQILHEKTLDFIILKAKIRTKKAKSR